MTQRGSDDAELPSTALHAHLHSGGAFSGEDSSAWDLNETSLRERFLEPRARGEQVWVKGKSFDWRTADFNIFEGPATAEITDFVALLGAPFYAMGGSLTDVTDRYVTGPPGGAPAAPTHVASDAIFIVHGRDEGRKEGVARYVSIVLPDTRVLVLHEQPNAGRTLIEKLEGTASAAQLAVVILTGDDEGQSIGGAKLSPRGRQNVVFELGFFCGKFGRAHVVVLYERGIELPSDLDGLAYIELDSPGAWKLELAREMRAAGFAPDLNRAE